MNKYINPKKENKSKDKKINPLYQTFALSGGERDDETGTTIPYEENVAAAKEFVDENKK